MTRMIERWFPCQEVSVSSSKGWGSGNSEVMLFSWFAKRPLAQAKAAVLTSLLPWPDDVTEQRRLQALVRRAMTGTDAMQAEIMKELECAYPGGCSLLDPFSGRAMIPLEASRLGVRSQGIDYSPVATVAGKLLADYPLRSWPDEPPLPFGADSSSLLSDRLVADVEGFLAEVTGRAYRRLAQFYPEVDGKTPWGYLWAMTLPCQECGHRFPLVGSLVLRRPDPKKRDPGQSMRLFGNRSTGEWRVDVHEGEPLGEPSRVVAPGKSKYDSSGKVAVCIHCGHVHPKDVHTRLAMEGHGIDALLVVADNDDVVQRVFRLPTESEIVAATNASGDALAKAAPFATGLPATPGERIPPGNTWTIQPSVYGARTYGDMLSPRQTLSFVELARAIGEVGTEAQAAGVSSEYSLALAEYACSVLVRRLKFSTRGARLRTPSGGVNVSDVFGNSESSWSFQYDYLETGLADGPGTWGSLSRDTLNVLRSQRARKPGIPAAISRGTACSLGYRSGSFTAVVTDPPYDSMIDYMDASDLYYVWMKRALIDLDPSFGITTDPYGLQEKNEEIIVKKGHPAGDHRTEAHYDDLISSAFSEARRIVSDNGVVSIVFGHGDPDVWHRLLSAVSSAGLVLTGSWPARTEKAKAGGGSNIVTTLTLACRPAPAHREPGRVNDVDEQVRTVIAERVPSWDAAGLALTDQLMASAGPAMEVVGRYSMILDKKGDQVELDRYLPLARRAVEEAADIKIDSLPLGTFDARTRFALFWARANGRAIAPASEARWERLASDLSDNDTEGVLVPADKGVRLGFGSEFGGRIEGTSPVIDVAAALARAGKSLADAAEVLIESGRAEDPYLWAAVHELSRYVPDGDRDGETWTWLVRNRGAVTAATLNVEAARQREVEQLELADRQGSLFGGDS